MNGDTLKILLVDDDEKFLLTLAERVELKEYEALTAPNGAKALEIAGKNRIHVAVVDQRLPDMEGLDVIAKLKERHPDLNTILLTAYGDDKLKEASGALDASYFEKSNMVKFWEFLMNVPFTNVNILLVDDDEKFLGSLAERIRLKGYGPLMALNGSEALDVAKSNKLHMAVVDQRLPDLDGLKVIAELKKIHPNIKTVLLTAFGDKKLKDATEALESSYFDKDDMGGFWGFVKNILRKLETSMAAAGMATGGDLDNAIDIDPSTKRKKRKGT